MKKVRDGYKMTELGEIPEEWEIKKIKDIANICYGKSQKEVEVEDGKYKILGTGGVIGYTNDFLWNRPSVLIGRKGTIDKPQYIEEPFWTVDTLFYTKINENYIAKWFYYYLDNIDLKKYNEATGVPSLSVANLNTIRIATPTKKEQEKIASILSTVDEQIDNVDALIEKNKELKKGLMQTLLTKGIGHTRFKKTEIGEIPEEWEVSKLGQLFYINTKSVEPSKLEEDILHYSLPAFDESRVPVKQSSIEIKSNKYLIEENSILVSKLNPRIKRIWLVNKVNFIKQICSTEFINYVAINKENVNLKYFEQYFNSDIFQQELLNRESGSTGSRKRVTPNSTMDIKIALPSSCEQEKIAIILSELDEKIEGYENKKQKLEELKKGLMQQLLTGNIRVI